MHAGAFNLPLVGVIELAPRLGAAPSIEGAKLNARLTPPALCGTAAHFAGAGALSGEPMTPNAQAALAILALVALVLLSGCGTTGRIGVAHDFKEQVKGDNPAAIIEVSKEFGNRYSCEYTHISHYSSGWPFNDRLEQSMDMAGCSVRVW